MVLKFVFELQHSTHFAHFPVHKKTQTHCRIVHLGSSWIIAGAANRNRLRAAVAW